MRKTSPRTSHQSRLCSLAKLGYMPTVKPITHWQADGEPITGLIKQSWVLDIFKNQDLMNKKEYGKWTLAGPSTLPITIGWITNEEECLPPARTMKELQGIWPTYSAQDHLHMSNKHALHLDIFKQVFQWGSLVDQGTNLSPIMCTHISDPCHIIPRWLLSLIICIYGGD